MLIQNARGTHAKTHAVRTHAAHNVTQNACGTHARYERGTHAREQETFTPTNKHIRGTHAVHTHANRKHSHPQTNTYTVHMQNHAMLIQNPLGTHVKRTVHNIMQNARGTHSNIRGTHAKQRPFHKGASVDIIRNRIQHQFDQNDRSATGSGYETWCRIIREQIRGTHAHE
jgi:hypothetical protein